VRAAIRQHLADRRFATGDAAGKAYSQHRISLGAEVTVEWNGMAVVKDATKYICKANNS
jgi:hypothetical protein